MKRWIILCLLMVPLLASAESYWEGDAALQRGDAAFESGLYAASNSFAPDTQLMIQNLDNGKSTTATVSERIDGQSDILVLLSPRAADAIGIKPGSIARVRVTVEQKVASTGSPAPESLYSPDQDVNPGAAFGGNEQATVAQQPSGQNQQSPAAPQEPAAVGQDQAGAASSGESQEAAEDAQILAEAEARHPQKQLFLPPREDQKFAMQPAPATAPAPQAPAQPEVPTVTGETGAPSQRQAEVPLAEAQPESPATPEEAVGTTPQPSQGEAGAQLTLPEAAAQPTGKAETGGASSAPASSAEGEKIALQPPETPPQQPAPSEQATGTAPVAGAPEQPAANAPQQPAAVPENPKAAGVQIVASLPKLTGKRDAATFYVQLGAYTTQQGAQDLAVRLMPVYPVVVLAPSPSDRQIYKVLVGPLNKAESGTLLPLFRFRGFRDAFVRRE